MIFASVTTLAETQGDGVVIYEGAQFGGERDEAFDAEMLPDGFETASYIIPKDVIHNGCVDLEFSEDEMGVMFREFRITHD